MHNFTVCIRAGHMWAPVSASALRCVCCGQYQFLLTRPPEDTER